jgi:hypothetical protein
MVGGRLARLRCEIGARPVGDQVAVPARHGLGAYQQPDALQYVAGQAVQQRGEQRPVGTGEPDLLTVQLPLEDRDLMAEGQDFGVLVAVTDRQQPQQCEGVPHAEVGKSNQHGLASLPSYHQRSEAHWNVDRDKDSVTMIELSLTTTDEVSAPARSGFQRWGCTLPAEPDIESSFACQGVAAVGFASWS